MWLISMIDHTAEKKFFALGNSGRELLMRWVVLSEKVFDQTSILFIVDSGEETSAQFSDGFRSIEWQAIVHLSTLKVTRHTFRRENRFDLSIEIDSGFGG